MLAAPRSSPSSVILVPPELGEIGNSKLKEIGTLRHRKLGELETGSWKPYDDSIQEEAHERIA